VDERLSLIPYSRIKPEINFDGSMLFPPFRFQMKFSFCKPPEKTTLRHSIHVKMSECNVLLVCMRVYTR
jgi:hypothetical protein